MAFCGKDLSDEKKDSDCADHSLDHIVAFSTKKQQMCAPSKEGLITSDKNGTPIDRRIKICYDDEKFFSSSYSAPCQITAIVPGGKKGVGSASAYVADRGKALCFITCAHNLVAWSSLRKRTVPFKDVRVYARRDGKKKWHFLVERMEKRVVHPKYNGQPDCGFDFGIITHAKVADIHDFNFKNFNPKSDSAIHWMNPKDVAKGMTIELIGYPGEKKGHAFTHTGKILDIMESDLGGWVIWYDADATPGNSGSAIWLTDEKYVKKHFNPSFNKLLIGVHTGHDEAEGCNFGTLFTQSLKRWIDSHVKGRLSE